MKRKFKIIEISVIFLFSLIPLLWFSPNQIILGHDSGFRLDIQNHMNSLLYSWNFINNFGVDWSFFKGFLMIQSPELLGQLLTHSLIVSQRITIIFWFFIMGISMYVFLFHFYNKRKDWFIRIFGSLFFMFNFFLLQGWFIAERAKFSIFAALPLGLLLLYKMLEEKYSIIKGTFLFSLVYLFLNGGGNPPLIGGTLIVYGVTVLYFFIRNALKKNWAYLFRSIKIIIFIFLISFTISGYWLLPQLYFALHAYNSSLSASGGIDGILGWESVISKNASILNLLRLQGIPDWYNNPSHAYSHFFLSNPVLILISFLFFFILLLCLFLFPKLFSKKNKEKELIFLFLFILILGIIFTGGTHPPLGFIYILLVKYLKGFAIFRSSYYKFGPALFFSYIILLTIFINAIFGYYFKKDIIRNILKITTIVLLLVYHFPFFGINFFIFDTPFSTKVVVPNYVTQMFAYINKYTNSSDRILLLPKLGSAFNADSYSWNFWSLDVLPRLGTNRSIIANDYKEPFISDLYTTILNDKESFLKEIGMLGINNILWRGDVLYSDKLVTSNNFIDQKNALSPISGFKVKENVGKWDLFSINNKWYLPKIYVPKEIDTYTGQDFNLIDLFHISNSDESKIMFLNSNDYPFKNAPKINAIEAQFAVNNIFILHQIENSLQMPLIRFLPWSKFYFLEQFEDNKISQEYKNQPGPRIDADLSLANKRLAEIWRMAFKDFNSQAGKYIDTNSTLYINYINDAIANLKYLDYSQKNQYIIKILGYIEFEKSYISNFNQNKLITNTINSLLSYMDDRTTYLNSNVWASNSNYDTKYFLIIPYSGDYTLSIQDAIIPPEKVIVDSNVVKSNSVFLSKGMHLIEMIFPQKNNYLIDNSHVVDTGVSIKMNRYQYARFSVSNIIPQKSYFISFSYKLRPKDDVHFKIIQNNSHGTMKDSLKNPYDSFLIADGKWHTLETSFTPYYGVTTEFLEFKPSFGKSQIEISNFIVDDLNQPRLYAVAHSDAKNINPPYISFQRINPTRFVISIRNAKNPYILQFGETFDRGWKAYIINQNNIYKDDPLYDDGLIKEFPSKNNPFDQFYLKTFFSKSLSEQNHLKTNGYSNGWYIDKKGSYTIILDYAPQKYFYIGIVITIISFVSSIIIFIKISYDHKK